MIISARGLSLGKFDENKSTAIWSNGLKAQGKALKSNVTATVYLNTFRNLRIQWFQKLDYSASYCITLSRRLFIETVLRQLFSQFTCS